MMPAGEGKLQHPSKLQLRQVTDRHGITIPLNPETEA